MPTIRAMQNYCFYPDWDAYIAYKLKAGTPISWCARLI